MWSVGCGGGVPEKKWAVRLVEFPLAEAVDGLVGEVGIEVVPLVGGGGGLDVLLITDEVWCPLIGLTVKKAVVVLEANAGRPHVVGASGALVASGEVPFPDCRGHVAIGL